tara:strand:+ start:372 stop:653 length:282 start_codon:yes stop_codon:yes gene_type:complete
MEILEFLNQDINLISEKGFFVICGVCITLCVMGIIQHNIIRRLTDAIHENADVCDQLVEKNEELRSILSDYGLTYTDRIDLEDISSKTRVSNN